MSRRIPLLVVLTAALVLAWSVPAVAGGWAVITLDSWPENVTAGKPVEVILTVRQHGRTLMEGLEVTLTGYHPASKRSILVKAQELKQPGQYAASLVFPEAGNWEWSVQAFTMDQRMPDLEVMGATTAPGKNSASAGSGVNAPVERPLALAGLIFLALGAGAAFFALSRRLRLAWMAAGVLGVLAAGSLLFTSQPPAQAAEAEKMEKASTLSPAALGEKLFIAKGCITCHVHPAFAGKGYTSLELKDLTGYMAIPEYLRVWLKDPATVKPKTEMPNLELKDSEIEALIAFLSNQETSQK